MRSGEKSITQNGGEDKKKGTVSLSQVEQQDKQRVGETDESAA